MSESLAQSSVRVRVVGYDVARCLAILSMVFVNFEVVLAMGAAEPAWMRTIASAFEGNASALFVTLAGVGIVLLGKREIILKRALLLLVVGYLWQVIWPGDILHYYAFYLAIGAMCLRLRAAWLWLLAALTIGAFLAVFYLWDYGAGWSWRTLEYPEFWTLQGQLRNLVFNGWHPLLPWQAFLFAGMALAKGGIHKPRNRRLALIVAVVVYGVSWFASQYLSQLEDTRSITAQMAQWYAAPERIWGMSSLPPGPFYMLSAGAVAVFVIALCLEVTARPAVAKATRPLELAGQLALTYYLGHVLVLYFVVVPLADSADMSPLAVSWWAAVTFGALAIVCATVLRQRYRRGPLEWLLRRLCG